MKSKSPHRTSISRRYTPENFVVESSEELDVLDYFRKGLIASCQPVNSQELLALERIAHARLSIYRNIVLETEIWDAALADVGNAAFDAEHDDGLAEAFRLIMRDPARWSACQRDHARSDRMHHQAIQEFVRLKALRGKTPNEPIAESQLTETKPVNAPKTNPFDGFVARRTSTSRPAILDLPLGTKLIC